jgi:hypothetical protein
MSPDDTLDLDAFRAPEVGPGAWRNIPSQKPPRHRPGEPFLKGPIPWPWLWRALTLPGKALHVAVLLWKEAGCRRKRTVRFRLAGTAGLGMHPDTARRGLRALEAAGLVSVRHRPGRALEVTLLETDPEHPANLPDVPAGTRRPDPSHALPEPRADPGKPPHPGGGPA